MPEDGATPVRRSVVVGCDVGTAFTAFTAEVGAWWPLATHSVNGQDAASVTMDARVDGAIIETAADGSRCTWGTFLRVEPPGLLVFTWHPGWDASHATEVEVRFSPDPGGTMVELTHRGWERHPRGAAARSSYEADGGWTLVLAGFEARTRAPSSG